MSHLRTWALLSIISAAVLLSPVLAFLLAIVAEIVTGWLFEGGVPVLIALAAAGTVGRILLSRFRGRPRENDPDWA